MILDLQATKGIKGDASKLSQYIQPNSVDEIIVSNPFPTAPFAGSIEFFLLEASKIMKRVSLLLLTAQKPINSLKIEKSKSKMNHYQWRDFTK